MFDKGLFGGMFDFNHDGKMDSFEKAAEFSFFMAIPVMLGASGLKVLKFILEGFTATGGTLRGGWGGGGGGGGGDNPPTGDDTEDTAVKQLDLKDVISAPAAVAGIGAAKRVNLTK